MITDFFGNGSDANALVIQPDGKIVAAGPVFTTNSDADFGLARYTTDGSLDPTFGIGGKVTTNFFDDGDTARALAIQLDGKIVAGGTAQHLTASADIALARYNPDGSLDTGFGAGGKASSDFHGIDDFLNDLAILPDGKILVSESGFDADDQLFSGLLRYNTDGSLDSTFGSDGKVIDVVTQNGFPGAGVIAIQRDGKIVTNGLVRQGDFGLVRYNPDGALDPTFGMGGKVSTDFSGGDDGNFAIAIQDDGNIVTGGSARPAPFSVDFALARYNGATFDICIQDDSNGNLLQFNSTTGEYLFTDCRKGITLTGRGKVTRDPYACKIALQDMGPTPKRQDRSVSAQVNRCTHAATASIQIFSTGSSFSITDRDITNNTCPCRAPGGGLIYSNFGPGMAFDTNPLNGWTINGFLGPGVGQQAIAHQFTPGATETFTGAQVALGLFSGPGNVAVFLQADSNGLPGPVLEQINLTGLTGLPTIFVARSALRPHLQGGTPYWLTVVAGGPGVLAGWNWNSIGDRSTASNFAGTQGGSPAGPWGLNFPGLTRSAFQINGSP